MDWTSDMLFVLYMKDANFRALVWMAAAFAVLVCAALLVFSVINIRWLTDNTVFNNNAPMVDVSGYRVLELPTFFGMDECDKVKALALSGIRGGMRPSTVYGRQDDKVDAHRISEQIWLRDEDDPLIAELSRRVATLTGTSMDSQEDWQVARYPDGGRFASHYDPCVLEDAACKRMEGDGGVRILTVLVYLNDNFGGGETVFPENGIAISPGKGKAVVFQSIDASSSTKRVIRQARHEARPVSTHGVSVEGKWIATKWIRRQFEKKCE
jgi:prolyl 4-hydroxylase